MKVAFAFVAGLIFAIASAQTADVDIDDFYGRWVGEGIAKTETETGNVR